MDLVTNNAKLRGIYITVDCLPVCLAVREHRRTDVRLITTDLFPQVVPYLEDVIIVGSIYQDPYTRGQTASKVLVDHGIEKATIASSNSLNPGVVLQSNLNFFRQVHYSGIGARDLTRMRTGARVSLCAG